MISIIVPVFNAQDYLEACIRSVLTQSFQDFELLLIDDGSTDDSLNICRRWEADPRVHITSTENHGVSHARNLGLQQACGSWVMFLDSDDQLAKGALEKLSELIAPDPSLVIGAYTEADPGATKALREKVSADSLRTMILDPINHDLLPDFYELKPMSLCACWGKLYRSAVIREHSIRFPEELRLSEDTLFNLDYLEHIDHALITDMPVIHYRHNEGSVTKVFREQHLVNRFRFFDLLLERAYPEAPVHILSLLLYEICRIERWASGSQKALEQQIIRYLSEHPAILHDTQKRALSVGKFQHPVYHTAASCFRRKAYRTGFALLRIYAAISMN